LHHVEADVLYVFFVLYPPFPYTSDGASSSASSPSSSSSSAVAANEAEQRRFREGKLREQYERARELEAMLAVLHTHEDRFADMLFQRRARVHDMMLSFLVRSTVTRLNHCRFIVIITQQSNILMS
jgi:hypothetical protein